MELQQLRLLLYIQRLAWESHQPAARLPGLIFLSNVVRATTLHSIYSILIPTLKIVNHCLFMNNYFAGERRLHSDGLTFIVRNAGHASGFDEFNQLKVY